MKKIILISLLSSFTFLSAQQLSTANKKQFLDTIDKKIRLMKEFKICIKYSKTIEEANQCKSQFKAKKRLLRNKFVPKGQAVNSKIDNLVKKQKSSNIDSQIDNLVKDLKTK